MLIKYAEYEIIKKTGNDAKALQKVIQIRRLPSNICTVTYHFLSNFVK